MSGAAELFVNIDGAAFPHPDVPEPFDRTTQSAVYGDEGALRVIDILTASIPPNAQRLVMGVCSTTSLASFHVAAQRVSVAPTMLSPHTQSLGALSPATPYAIFDVVVDAQSFGSVSSSGNGSLSEMYIVGTAISGQIRLGWLLVEWPAGG